MEALDLILLGRQLARIGEAAMRGGGDGGGDDALRTGTALVLRDVFAHPGTSIGDVAARTGLPQGYVSECAARLREAGTVDAAPDRDDGRRVRLRVAERHAGEVARRGAVPVDAALARAFGEQDAAGAAALVATLDDLARRLRQVRRPGEAPGPIVAQIERARGRGRSDSGG